MAQETQTGVLYQPGGMGWKGRCEGDSKGRRYKYTCGLFMLRFDRKQNSVKQIFFNKKQNKKKKNESWPLTGWFQAGLNLTEDHLSTQCFQGLRWEFASVRPVDPNGLNADAGCLNFSWKRPTGQSFSLCA